MSIKVYNTLKGQKFKDLGTRDQPTMVCPFGPEIYFSQIDQDILKYLQDFVKQRKNNDKKWNKNLAGMIEEEYILKLDDAVYSDKLAKEIVFHLEKMFSFFTDPDSNTNNDLKVTSIEFSPAWVNVQRPGEFNPMHSHSGAYSFIIYVDIPDNVRNEHLEQDKNWQYNSRGMLEFRHSNSGMGVSPKTGDIIIFPATLEHAVYPFRSNEERISISGNVNSIDTRGNNEV